MRVTSKKMKVAQKEECEAISNQQVQSPRGVGIMIEGCDSASNTGSDEYVELPAITKVLHDPTPNTSDPLSEPRCQQAAEGSLQTSPENYL